MTKAFVYQNIHGLYPDSEFPPPLFLNLGVEYGSLREFVEQKVTPLFGKSAQQQILRRSNGSAELERAKL